ncbi:hypothetical protein [Cerasicoccus arenae]|nr:hypothetical protein [Cerasicoccus arenae]
MKLLPSSPRLQTRTFGLVACLLGIASVSHAATIFEQNFNSSNTVSDYVLPGGTASGSLFTDISGPAGMTQSITNGALLLSNVSGSGNDSQGFRYTGGFTGGTPSFLMVEYDFDLTTSSNSTGQTNFVFGNNDEVSRPYGQGSISTTNSFGYVAVKGGNTAGTIQISVNTTSGFQIPAFTPEGTLTFRLYLNDTGGNVNYVGPNGGNYTSNSETISVWYEDGGTWNDYNLNVAANSGDLYGFRFIHKNTAESVAIDNIAIYDSTVIPEPSQVALAMGSFLLVGAMIYRRRKA